MAGLAKIPAIVKDAAPAEALELALIENIQREDLNPIEAAEALGKKRSRGQAGPDTTQKSRSWKDPQIASLEERLRQSLGTKVKLTHKGKKGGKIEIEYYSLDELDRLLEIFIP